MKHLLLLLALAAVIGCAPPYFAGLDAAAPLAHQMTRVGFMGPVSTNESDIATGMRFLPTRPTAASIGSLSVTSGFVITTTLSTEWLSFVYLDSSGVAQVSFPEIQFTLIGADPNYPLNEYDVAATTTTANIVVFTMNPTTPSSSTAELLRAALPGGPLALPTPPPTSGNPEPIANMFGGQAAVGVQYFPASATADNFNLLVVALPYGTGPGYAIDGVTHVLSASGAALPGIPALTLPSPVNRFLYYYNPATTNNYAEYNLNGQWVCYQWTPAAPVPVTLAGVTHRVDALLTSGELLSTEGGTLRLYDSTGTQELAVPMNGMQFSYEAYIGTTPYVFFSFPMSMKHGWGFNVYAVPTASMKSLH